MSRVRVHIFVEGFVQGVFFRQNTKKIAEALGLKGWVRNTFNGKVEAIFEGEKRKIEEILNWVKKGPTSARIDGVDIQWEEYKGEFNDFEIKFD